MLGINKLTVLMFFFLFGITLQLILKSEILFLILSVTLIYSLVVLVGVIGKSKKFAIVLYLSTTIKLLLALINVYIYPLPDSQGDALFFKSEAILNSKNNVLDLTSNLFLSNYYIDFLTLFFKVFGSIQIIPEIINVIFSIFIIYAVYLSCVEVYKNQTIGYIASLIIAFYPTHLLYSSISLRENYIVFFFSLSVLFLIKWIKRSHKKMELLLSILFLILSSTVHSGMLMLSFIYPVSLVYANKGKRTLVLYVVGAFVLITSILYIVNTFQLGKIGDLSTALDPSNFTERRENISTSRGAYLQELTVNNYIDLIIFSPLLVFYFLFSPFIWQVTSITDFIGIIDSILIAILIYFSIKTFRLKKHTKYIVLILILLFIGILVFSFGTGNYGTAIRHRSKFIFLLSISSSYYIYYKYKISNEVRLINNNNT